MSKTTAPIFRKSVNGYNRSDVNAYIISLSRRLEDAERANASLSARNAELEEKVASMQGDSVRLQEMLESQPKLTAELEECRERMQKAEEENEGLRRKAEVAGEEYDKLCRSAGQIFALAGNTADDILRRADDEAHRIVDDAKAARNTVFKSISETTDGFTSDLSDYIKTAISDCIEKINENVSAYTEQAKKNEGAHTVTFIDGN